MWGFEAGPTLSSLSGQPPLGAARPLSLVVAQYLTASKQYSGLPVPHSVKCLDQDFVAGGYRFDWDDVTSAGFGLIVTNHCEPWSVAFMDYQALPERIRQHFEMIKRDVVMFIADMEKGFSRKANIGSVSRTNSFGNVAFNGSHENHVPLTTDEQRKYCFVYHV